jgi:hypothetical protein
MEGWKPRNGALGSSAFLLPGLQALKKASPTLLDGGNRVQHPSILPVCVPLEASLRAVVYWHPENARISRLFLHHEWVASFRWTCAVRWRGRAFCRIGRSYPGSQTRNRRDRCRTPLSIPKLRFLVPETPNARQPKKPGLRPNGNNRSERETTHGFLRHYRFLRQIVRFVIIALVSNVSN